MHAPWSGISTLFGLSESLTPQSKSVPIGIMGLDFIRPLRAVCVVSTVAVSFSACQQPTQITLEITTDIKCELSPETAIVVGNGEVESTEPGTVTEMCNDGRIGAIVLLPRSAKDERISVRVVMGIGTKYSAEDCLQDPELQDDVAKDALGNPLNEGCIMARRTLNFIPSTPLFLPVKMRGACLGEPCTPGYTCVTRGECIPDLITNSGSCSDPAGCELPNEIPDGGIGGAGGNGGAGNSSTTSSSSSGKGGTGGIMMDGGNTGGTGGIGGMAMVDAGMVGGFGGTGGTGGSAGMTGTGGMGGMDGGPTGPSSSSSASSSGATGGMDGGMPSSSSSSSSGGYDGGMASSSSSSGIFQADSGLADALESGLTVNTPDVSTYDEMLISPGSLIPGQPYSGPNRRKRVRRTQLNLPLYTFPRNVKP